VRRTYADADGRYADHAPRPRVLVAADDVRSVNFATMNTAIETFSLRQEDRTLQLSRFSSGGQFSTEASAPAETADAAAIRIRAWMLAYAIEYVLVSTADSPGEVMATAAGGLGIPAVRTPADPGKV
jgi:hypothetical protein